MSRPSGWNEFSASESFDVKWVDIIDPLEQITVVTTPVSKGKSVTDIGTPEVKRQIIILGTFAIKPHYLPSLIPTTYFYLLASWREIVKVQEDGCRKGQFERFQWRADLHDRTYR